MDLCWLDKSAVNLEPVSATNANHFVGNARIKTAVPCLLVNRCVPFAGNLSIGEPIAPKFLWQWPVGMAFPSTSLGPRTRFWAEPRHPSANNCQITFLFWGWAQLSPLELSADSISEQRLSADMRRMPRIPFRFRRQTDLIFPSRISS